MRHNCGNILGGHECEEGEEKYRPTKLSMGVYVLWETGRGMKGERSSHLTDVPEPNQSGGHNLRQGAGYNESSQS